MEAGRPKSKITRLKEAEEHTRFRVQEGLSSDPGPAEAGGHKPGTADFQNGASGCSSAVLLVRPENHTGGREVLEALCRANARNSLVCDRFRVTPDVVVHSIDCRDACRP